MANPELIGGFDTSDNNTAEPTSGLKSNGYQFGDIVESTHFNYMLRQLYAAVNKSANDGVWDWEDPASSERTYSIGSIVRHSGTIWWSSADANTDEPGIGANWRPIPQDEINVDTITDKAGTGAPDFPNGLTTLSVNGLSVSLGGGDVNTNTAVGDEALRDNTTGTQNTANGYRALLVNTTGVRNTASGSSALYFNNGNNNTAFGAIALMANTSGVSNTANGSSALYMNTSGSQNTASGHNAMYSNTIGYENTASGYRAMYNNTTGHGNAAFGLSALDASTTSIYNSAFGSYALYASNGGSYNCAFGYSALRLNSSGSNNVAFGSEAAYSNTSGNYLVAIGDKALYYNTTANYNIGIGRQALCYNTTGSGNTSVGYFALNSNTTGDTNVAVGREAASANTTGVALTAVGGYALNTATAYDYIVGLGHGAQVTGSYQVQLGGVATTTYAYGAVQDRSDIRDKADVRDTTLGLDFIMSLRPVDYKWDMREDYRPTKPQDPIIAEDATQEEIEAINEAYKAELSAWSEACKLGNITHDGSKKRNRYHHGFIAQEIESIGVDFGGYQDHSINGGDDVKSIGYTEFIAPLVKAVQEQQALIKALQDEIALLKGV